jgi:hypothetical protein
MNRLLIRWMLAIGVAVGLLLGVYVPTFLLSTVLHLRLEIMVPVVIVVSAMLAFAYVLIFVRRGRLSLADFGVRWPDKRYVVAALALSVPASLVITLLLERIHEPGPLKGMHLSLLLAWLYFGLGAPLQEEFIFRGLLQTTLTRNLIGSTTATTHPSTIAMVCVAVMFALVHLEVGPFTAIGALVLGLLAGELRRRSGSLFPAVLAHAIFNIGGLLAATS